MMDDGVAKTLFVGQVPLDSTVEDVQEWFSPFGTIQECRLKPGTKSHCAFVKLERFSEAEAALHALNGHAPVPGGPVLNIAFSKPRGLVFAEGDVASDRKLFLGQLGKGTTEADLQQLLSPYGALTKVAVHRPNGQPSGCGFCTFSTWAECEAAMEGLDRQVTMPGAAHPLTVTFATPRVVKDAGKRALEGGPLPPPRRAVPALAYPTLKPGLGHAPYLAAPAPPSLMAPAFDVPPEAEAWKLFIGQLPADATEEELHTYCALYGDVVSVHVLRDASGRSKGCAFVQYTTAEAADTAISALHKKARLRGRLMTAELCTPRPLNLGPAPTRHPPPDPMPPADPTPRPSRSIVPIPASQGSQDYPHKLFVGQIPSELEEHVLEEFFGSFGRVCHVHVLRDPHTLRSKGCCFVVYETPEEAQGVMDALAGHITLNPKRPLTLEYAIPR